MVTDRAGTRGGHRHVPTPKQAWTYCRPGVYRVLRGQHNRRLPDSKLRQTGGRRGPQPAGVHGINLHLRVSVRYCVSVVCQGSAGRTAAGDMSTGTSVHDLLNDRPNGVAETGGQALINSAVAATPPLAATAATTAAAATGALPAELSRPSAAPEFPPQANPASPMVAKTEQAGPTGPAAPAELQPAGRRPGLMSPADQRFLRWLLVGFLTLLTVEWLWLVSRTPRPPELQRGACFQQLFRVEINQATWVDWIQLEGIGPSLAHRIEADRRLNGPFRSIDDLRRVPGIGPVTLERLRPQLFLTALPPAFTTAASEPIAQQLPDQSATANAE